MTFLKAASDALRNTFLLHLWMHSAGHHNEISHNVLPLKPQHRFCGESFRRKQPTDKLTMRRSASHCELVGRLFSVEAFPTKPMLGFKSKTVRRPHPPTLLTYSTCLGPPQRPRPLQRLSCFSGLVLGWGAAISKLGKAIYPISAWVWWLV